MSSFLRQLRVLLWKNWLGVLRQPVWSLVLILWPVAIFSILAITRSRFPPQNVQNCYLGPRNLQSTGFFPFLQTFYCDDDVKCKNTSYVQKASSRISSRSSESSVRDSPYKSDITTTMNTLTALMEEHNLLYLDDKISDNRSTSPDSQNSSLNWISAIPVGSQILSIEQILNGDLRSGDIKHAVCSIVFNYLKAKYETFNKFCLSKQSVLEFGLQELGNILSMKLIEPENQILFLTEVVKTVRFIQEKWRDTRTLLNLLVMLPKCFKDAISSCSAGKQSNPEVTSNNSLFQNIQEKIPCFLNCLQLVKQGDDTSDILSWQSLKAWFEIVATNKIAYTPEETQFWDKMKPYVEIAYWLTTSLRHDEINTNKCQFNISGPNVTCNSYINWIQLYQSVMVLMKDINREAKER